MVDAREAAQEAANKIMSKSSRWRTKIFAKDDAKHPEPKPTKSQNDDDVNAFLRPSTEKALQQQDAAAAFLASARPRIDVARAQRWPGAQDIINSAAAGGKSPGPGGLRTSTRKKGLSVSFARAVPEIIGHGGDECEEPSAEVSRRKKATSAANASTLAPQKPQDDAHLSTSIGRTPSQTEQRNSLTRTLTSHGERSPPLDRKLEMGHINSHAHASPPPPQRVGQMGLGERPRALARAPTGFDSMQIDTDPHRPSSTSHESDYSQDSDNVSPVLARKISNPAPTIQEEEDDFRPKPISRTQTGFSSYENASSSAPVPAMPPMPTLPRLPGSQPLSQDDESPVDSKAMLVDRYLQNEPSRSDSFTARVKQRMRAEEGKTLHEGAHTGSSRDSDSSMQSERFQVGTPPSNYRASPLSGRSPPQSHPAMPLSPSRLEPDDPFRSRARGPSPARRGPPPGSFPTDADGRPDSSSSSQYSIPQSLSQTHGSPTSRAEPFPPTANGNIQRTPSLVEKTPYSAVSQGPIVPPPQFAPGTTYQALPPPQTDQGPAYQALPPPQPQAASQMHPPPVAPPSTHLPMRPRQDTHQQSQAPLGRSDTKTLGEAAFNDFADRVTHMTGIFALTAQLGGALYERTPMQWLRVATWWFLRGRAGMESMIRSRPRNAESQPERLTQAHVDLAKVLWITTEVLPNHPKLQQYGGSGQDAKADAARAAGDSVSAEALEIQSAIVHYMKLLVGSMKKHQSMPPTQALIQGQDQSIWAEYPRFAADAASVLQAGIPRSGNGGRNGAAQSTFSLSQYIPLADSKNDFCYFRMFVKASMSTDDPNSDRVPMTAVMSILRPKDQYQVKLSICSQSELMNIVLGPGVDGGPTWDDVSWKKQSNSISIRLRHGFTLTMELSEGDWRSLYSIVDHTNRVQTDLREKADERPACRLQLREAIYKDPTNAGAFPQDRVQGCKLLVFEKIERSSEGTGKRKLHRGYRMALATHQQHKQVSLVNHEIGTNQAPVNFEYITETDNAPAMRLYFREEGPDKKPRICTVHLIFQEGKDRNELFGTLTAMNVARGEMTFAQVPLKSLHIESADQAEGFSQKGSRVLEKLQWQEAKIVNQDAEANGLEAAPTVMSESLRIVCRHSAGIIADRMNLGPGELLIRLPIDGAPELTLLRNAQQDLTLAIDGSRTERGIPEDLGELLKTLAAASTIRKLTFNSFKDLHTFQYAVTGFDVKFDGIASSFSISRRRMVVPIYKQWTANTIRIQVVEQDNILQLLAFFEDFSHADAMNFQLRVTDTFEKTDKGGKFGLKLVDAKFALPVEERRGEGKMQKEEGRLSGWAGTKRKFVCLDEIEYPGEHDDILIQFDSAETRDVFAAALPAATVKRKFTVSRKI
ncbi:hypothetical protein HBI56_071360 [Parastagonospora nodorum]|nr:hypothetical protein HBI10_085910 [Parastagonospora nodorum]KAH4027143.1 hypothetical protein HBI13_054920 [Parastagonospora nodorum]KAH4810461.1 hypothetical protein HBH61_103290 [Parastagonospora nodorum]KAH4914696.1 hypothetical protein HBH74_148640 [Parastagonospora nodorum]KAH4974430.1 hypothetical protein HBH73_047340 [Parastagonospora nodorum]